MDKPETLDITTRKQWRNWLSDNYKSKQEVWLIYPKKSTGKPRIEYNEAVEEALCFGWIDSIVKSMDKDHTMQRFTPRKPQSTYSQANKERLRWLVSKHMIHTDFQKQVDLVIKEDFVFPQDILNTLKKDKEAWSNFQCFSNSYKRIRIAYIESARKRPDEFKKRLDNFINKTKVNKLIRGFGGIEKYY